MSLGLVLCLSWSGTAFAQSAEEVVQNLNGEAMEAYNNLEIDKAGGMLEEALRIGYEASVPAPLMARTNLNLGVVIIGGLKDNDAGLAYFVQALCFDPTVQLDPLMSTPDMQSVFEVAQQQVQAGACQGAQPGPAAPPAGPPPGPAAAPPPPPDQAILHYVPAEQQTQTPLPLYAEVNPAALPKRMFLYYKGLGMEQYKRVPMYVYQNGFAYQISCNDVWEPKVSYYLEAHNSAGEVVGVAGSATQPIVVPVVAQLKGEAPALPGMPPPQSCAAGECPPEIKGCVQPGTAGIGESCDDDGGCQSGLECVDDQCMLVGARGTEGPDFEAGEDWGDLEEPEVDDPSQFKRWFFQIGATLGLAYVQSGMLADRPSPDNRVFVDEFARYVEDPAAALASGGVLQFPEPGRDSEPRLTAWVPDADSSDRFGQLESNCEADGTATGPAEYQETGDINLLFPSKYCVRVKSAGFVPAAALRAAFGYFLTDRFSAAAIFRYQLNSGEGTFAGMLLGLRGEYMLTQPKSKGLMLSAFAGGTFGQIQAQPPAEGDTEGAPFARSGLTGAHVGSNLRFRFDKQFGVIVAPEADLQFPTFLLNIDLTLGLEAAF